MITVKERRIFMRRLDAGNVVCVCGTLYRFTTDKELKVGSFILDDDHYKIYILETEGDVLEYQKKPFSYTVLEPLSISNIIQEEKKCQR